NPFLPENLEVIVPAKKLPKPGASIAPPTVVEPLPADGGVWKVRHKLDDIFAQPTAVCIFQLVSPVAYESPRTRAALSLFKSCLDEHLNEDTYDARVAGLHYDVRFNARGVTLTFGGYCDKMPGLIDKVAKAVATYNPTDPVEFERLRDVVSRILSSYDTQDPLDHAESNANEAIEDPRFTVKELRDTLDSIELKDLRSLGTRVIDEAEGLCLLQGNLKNTDIPE
ncbi:unnamed protein product, partial [Scytosiphon promiscuus]